MQGHLTSFRRFSRFNLALTYRQNLKIQRVSVGSALELRDLFFQQALSLDAEFYSALKEASYALMPRG